MKRPAAKNALKFGAVAVNGRPVRQFDHPLEVGDVVTIGSIGAAVAAERLERARIEIVYEDDDLLVVDKPAGLLTVATDRDKTDTLFARLTSFLRERAGRPKRGVRQPPERAFVVHRLDQDTSGLVLFAKSESMKLALQAVWPSVEKTYWAVVYGRPRQDSGTITSFLTEGKNLSVTSKRRETPGSKEATTHFQVEQVAGRRSLISVQLETGRKHQIRVHLAEIGCPVIGDRRYGKATSVVRRLALHAGRLSFLHPRTGEELTIESPLPKQLAKLLIVPS